MDRANIVKPPTEETLEAVRRWREKRFGKSSIETGELPLGKYNIVVKFKKRDGTDCVMSLDYPATIDEKETMEDLKRRAISEAS